ncbi:3-carboxy-cis,cis-muconate cycloisomerase [Aeromicrobium camelliae]|uniref:3-carboxy-cis,cis-muconate cycloisomerase n=1 Tax=Aeromicrobium camelliae TaxID=1538144 RepID=A0A3N6X5Q1_9ACTN|nr:lyase family protein [Aeromicrobium camelliae]RQN08998.1 3-carboxy-cis,cis-muconate cycloisomerase [Aeromicrobium camelliae]
MTTPMPARGLDLLAELYGDREMAAVFSASNTIDGWKKVEAALAHAQGRLGIIDPERAAAIEQVCADPASIDEDALWESARNVGYPILGLVRQLDAALAPQHRGSVHLGATTQDIMDSGLALQLDAALAVLERRLRSLGDALAALTAEHAETVMAGRTHGQQAVPTTLGAKLGVYLAEVTRHRSRLLECRDDVRRVSLFGAGGTSDALGDRAAKIRTIVAERLGLVDATVPWHASRDAIVHVAAVCVGSATSASRLAREVTDLSRTEIGEVTEAVGHHRGASSTMPQKSNPIFSESIIGFAVSARTAFTGLSRAAEVGHERSAGEWQIEWSLIPALFVDTASALALAAELVETLAVHPDRMRANLDADGGLIMSESAMIALAPHLGREEAHDAVYALAQQARRECVTLQQVLTAWLADHPHLPSIELDATTATGDASQIAAAAVGAWRSELATHPRPWKDPA